MSHAPQHLSTCHAAMKSGAQLDIAAVFVVAVGLRALMVARSAGGFFGNVGYDSAVYYAASDALIHGRAPYRDFLLLHPPGLMLALTPFAALGRVTTDHIGFVAANLGFIALGGLNAVLVVLVAQRMLLGRLASLAGGMVYAVWLSSIGAEFSVRLEPLGNVLALLGLLALTTHELRPRPWLTGAAGFAFGAATSVKIWWLAPFGLIIVWAVLVDRSARRALWLSAGAAVSVLLIDGPFLALAPGTMLHMVVLDQLGRPRSTITTISRLRDLAGLTNTGGVGQRGVEINLQPVSHNATLALSTLMIGAVTIGCALAWQIRQARMVATLSIVQVGIVIAGPSWAWYYNDFLAVPLCLTGAAATATLIRRSRMTRKAVLRGTLATGALAPVVIAAVGTAAALSKPTIVSIPFPAGRLIRAVSTLRCVMADAPIALVELNVLSRDLENGCPNWVDVTGRTYGVDAPPQHHGHPLARVANVKWQHDLRRYLLSGDAVILVRPATGISATTLRALTRGAVLAKQGDHTVTSTHPVSRPDGASLRLGRSPAGRGLSGPTPG